MNEYRDQDTWFELWEYDGFVWSFVADFDTREQAEEYRGTWYENEDTRIKRARGVR